MLNISVSNLTDPPATVVLVAMDEGRVRITASSQGVCCLIENDCGEIVTSCQADVEEIARALLTTS